MDREQAKQLLKEVLGIIEEMHIPEDLRPTALQLLWAGLAPVPVAASPTIPEEVASPKALQALGTRLGISDLGHLADLYATDPDGMLEVRVPTNKLAAGKRVAAQELALLTCAGRQAAGEDATPHATLRAVCDRYGKLDSGNFSTALKAVEHLWMIGGTSHQKTYKLRTPGWEEAKELVKRVADIS